MTPAKQVLLGAAILAMTSAHAAAQSGRGYVGGSFVVTAQGSHTQGSAPSLPNSGAGGTAPGISVEAGVSVQPSLGVGVEVNLPARIESLQETDYFRVFQHENRHRDMTISGVVRVGVVRSRRASLWIVGGGGLNQENTRRRRRDAVGLLPTFPPVFGPYSNWETFTRWAPALAGGVDVAIAAGRHLSVVPQMRVHWIRRSHDTSEPGWFLGLDSWVFRPGVGLRVGW